MTGDTRDQRRGHGLRAVGTDVARVTKPARVRRGLAQGELVERWREIAGPALAEGTVPRRITFARGRRDGGTLTIRVEGGLALELQHLAPLIIEKINMFFGYRAVERLVLDQGPVPRTPRRGTLPVKPLDPAAQATLDRRLATIGDPALRAALADLGGVVLGEAPDQTPVINRDPRSKVR
jgi:hypothetical protein